MLEATIQHVEGLKARGVRHLAVAPETLRALAQSTPAAAPPTQPRSSRREEALPKKSEFRNPNSEIDSRFLTPAATTPSSPAAAAPVQSAIRNPQSGDEKAAAFAALRERALACVKCPNLAASRQNVVFGVGNIDSPLMFVGEAP
ncbi:MAG TPA: uracil-DNA glycosylase, partial [Candidatus Dormibacteraeota bacterium]|nr:uracil-DNA glycosylase [Candidatus Dormibacteraeota bacterium]